MAETTTSSLLSRVWTSLLSWFRAAPADAIAALPAPPSAGSDFAPGGVYSPAYSPKAALSAYAAFPWVYAACMRASRDFAGVPLVVVRGRRAKAVALDDHPIYDTFDRPSLRVTGRQFRAQQWLDLTLAGNHLVVVSGARRSTVLTRMHPNRMALEPHPADGWGDYLWQGTGTTTRIPADAVLHTRTPSWEDDPRGLWGTGATQSLNNDLNADAAASKSAATLSKRGRPDIIVSPKEGTPAGVWDTKFRDQLKDSMNRLLDEGGALVVGAGANIEMPTWTPRDMEFPALRQLVREAVLAVTGVPPHLVGLPVANYAQAEAQAEAYWERLRSLHADVCESCWSPLARRWDPLLSVRGDFSGIASLSRGRTEGVKRVRLWVDLGLTLADAAAYEGFVDVPATATAPAEPASQAPDGTQAVRFFQRGLASERANADRASAWDTIERTVRAPIERQILAAVAPLLTAQGGRVAARLQSVRRDVIDDLIATLLPPEEDAVLRAGLAADLRAALVAAYTHGADQVGRPEMAWSPLARDVAVEARLGALVAHVSATTRDDVRAIVQAGLDGGDAVADIAAKLMRAEGPFGPARALRIARTEATTAVSAGAQAAYRDAATQGVKVRKALLSARDENVRETHLLADGQERALGEDYVLADGDHGPGPGRFTLASNNVNCRCCEIPVIDPEDTP